MLLLTGPVEFNGAVGKYSVSLQENSYEREVRVGEIVFWDAFDGECYWQSFGPERLWFSKNGDNFWTK